MVMIPTEPLVNTSRCGILAEEWNLKREVSTEQYERLAVGLSKNRKQGRERYLTPSEQLEADGSACR